MATIVSSSLTFPPISWWISAIQAEQVLLDVHEHFQKMSYRNRYRISGSVNTILLSVPLTNGRNQRVAMKDATIYNQERWQVQHWRTLVSVYKRTPYFEHYEPSLQRLFETEYRLLTDFNSATLQWVKAQLKLTFGVGETSGYIAAYPDEIMVLRNATPIKESQLPRYHQVFEDRIGYQADLSILDLLFAEGPHTTAILQQAHR